MENCTELLELSLFKTKLDKKSVSILVSKLTSNIEKLDLHDMSFLRDKDRREGWTDARSAVGFCLGSGLFGSYNSD